MQTAANELETTVATLPDWTRETKKSVFEWSPYKSLLGALRCYQANRDRRGIVPAIRWRWAAARWRFWSVVGGISIPLRCQIGGGLQMPHTNGIVINVGATIGCNCEIFQQVTIGDGACIGANALVIRDVPAGARVFATPSEIHVAPLKAAL
jgi:serine O-acetyltransferase